MRDVLVIGGGPVGTFTAAVLAASGLDVEVWERRTAASDHSRAIGIHPPSLHAFAKLGVDEAFLEQAVLIHSGIATSRGRELGVVSFDRSDARYPFIVAIPQSTTSSILNRKLSELTPDALRMGVRLDALRFDGPVVHAVGTADADGPSPRPVTTSARYVVGADGARSLVRRLLGIRAPERTYPDSYVMGDFADETGAGSTAVIHLEPGGVVESFPLPHDVRRFVVRTDEPADGITPDDLAQLVHTRTGLRVDPTTSTMVSAFGVRRRIAHRMVHGRVILLGDAAHEISPIGGQGMNLGWGDAIAFAELIARGVRAGTSPMHALEAVGASRVRAARRAARQAEANMALGRPAHGPALLARDAMLRLALATPARRILADAYTMRWL